jgi:hypothetical protein
MRIRNLFKPVSGMKKKTLGTRNIVEVQHALISVTRSERKSINAQNKKVLQKSK